VLFTDAGMMEASVGRGTPKPQPQAPPPVSWQVCPL